ncbi:hypothetical protein P2H44_21540 [Albimonas sp. CAU 1670]|uniref:hypothetical protein n=1 Tax=Albimonas sp. CAU 1670 TaxID=3032599 RepID=UPI0023DAA12F|nr:hypothetical protein [Albimonas sp. CAU 1670]MDF2235148.1 hypothetical protein [Albimonas sp. CAU 1670]
MTRPDAPETEAPAPRDPEAAAARESRFHGEGEVQRRGLWRVATGPIIWGAHFLACYWIGAVWCARAGPGASLDPARWAIAGATVVAILALGLVFRALWRVRGLSVTDDDLVYEADDAEERRRFLAHVSMLLCVVSLVAIVYSALPAALLGTCR